MIFNGHIQPKKLREFADSNCPALDFFLVRDGRAESCQNESYIEEANSNDLILRLRAVKFWERPQGRLQADIDWTFTIDDGVNFPFTCLPNMRAVAKNPAEMSVKELVSTLKPAQFWSALGALS